MAGDPRNARIRPITLQLRRHGGWRSCYTLEQLADYLLNYWPGEETELLVIARKAVLDAYDGVVTPEEAREAVVEAARDANVGIMREP